LPRYVNMKELKAIFKAGFFALAILIATNAKSQTIDQFDTSYNSSAKSCIITSIELIANNRSIRY